MFNPKSIFYCGFHENICTFHEENIDKSWISSSWFVHSLKVAAFRIGRLQGIFALCLKLFKYPIHVRPLVLCAWESDKIHWKSMPSSDVVMYPGFKILSPCSPIVITSADLASKISYISDERVISFPRVWLELLKCSGVLRINFPLTIQIFRGLLLLWCMAVLYIKRVNIWSLANHLSL